MRLFDYKVQRVSRFSKYSESYFEYMNISNRNEFNLMREKIEEWFSHYPQEEQHEFKERFRTDNDEQFISAFYELLLHESLKKLNFNLSIHPTLVNSTKRPDFLVNDSNEEFYLEVALSTNKTKEEIGQTKLLSLIYDIIDEIKTSNFFVGVEINKLPDKPIPASNLRNFLQIKLNELNPDYCENIVNKFGWDAIPKWVFNYNGFEDHL